MINKYQFENKYIYSTIYKYIIYLLYNNNNTQQVYMLNNININLEKNIYIEYNQVDCYLNLLRRLYKYLFNNYHYFDYHYHYSFYDKIMFNIIQTIKTILSKDYHTLFQKKRFLPVLNSINNLDNITIFMRFAHIPPNGIIVQRYLKEEFNLLV